MALERAAEAYRNTLANWVGWSVRRARPVALGALALTLAALAYFIDGVAINTSTTDMLSKDLPFRQKSREIDAAFPQADGTLVVVIDAQTADIADDAALTLGKALRDQPALFSDVFDLMSEPFFRRNGLLYMDLDELYDLGDRLAEAQPFLSALWREPNLGGFFRMLGLAADAAGDADSPAPLNLARALDSIAQVAEAQAAGRFHLLSWTKLMGGDDEDPADRRRFIVVKPVRDYASLQPAARAIDRIRELARDLGLTPDRGLRVRLTGSAALDEEELQSVETGMGLAAAVSLVLVLGLLMIGLRSPVLVIACLATLIAGLVWTAAFAILAIGTLNLISVAFAVLFIGLSVDFGIHFALRYREQLWRGFEQHDALAEAARGAGGALTLCAVSAALAFYAFLPTDYVGLAELGLIAGTGMVIALFANMTLLPALIALAPLTARLRGGRPSALGERLNPAPWLARHAGAVCVAALALTLGAAALLPRVAFDFDPLNLKDPTTESVATLHDLMRDGRRSHHTTDVLAPSLAAADALAARLTALDLVDSARTLSSYVPADQDEKLQVIADLALLIGPALSGGGRPVRLAPSGRAAAWTALKPKLDALGRAGNNGQATAARRMIAAVDGLAGGGATRLLELENRLLTGLPGRLTALSQSLRAGPVALDGLPAALRDRNVAADGRALIEVAPSEPLADRDAIRRFVTEVRTVAPDAVGSPVVILEAGRTVLGAFAQACLTAVVGIVALLWLVLGRAWDVGLVFVPLALAGLWTLGAAAAFGVAFNLANVIVLPLLFGLGVAGGIHLVSRARASGEIGEAMRTSTPRAVLFSALTTIGSFGSISLSAHPGTASMGVLLTLALAMTLLSTLVFLPALLAWLGERRADGDG